MISQLFILPFLTSSFAKNYVGLSKKRLKAKHILSLVYKNNASWTNSPKKHTQHLDCNEIIRLMNWLLDNIYVSYGDQLFRQVIGIPMGTDCAPFLANLFL